MATLFHYKCTDCDFDIMSTPWGGDVYGGGYGYYKYICDECKHLTDIEHGFTERARKEIENDIEDELFECTKGSSKQKNTCSHCGSPKLLRWEPERDRCPNCGGIIIRVNDIITNTD